MSEVKTCSTCQVEDEFYHRTNNGNLKYEASCKECMLPKIKERAARSKAKRVADPELLEKYKARMKAFDRSEKGKAAKKAYHARPEVQARASEQVKTNLNVLIRACKQRDVLKKRISDIDHDWLKSSLDDQAQKCHYCQTTLSLCIRDRTLDQVSIDRKDNSLGYIKTNCLLTCLFCNYCRNETEYDLFLEPCVQTL